MWSGFFAFLSPESPNIDQRATLTVIFCENSFFYEIRRKITCLYPDFCIFGGPQRGGSSHDFRGKPPLKSMYDVNVKTKGLHFQFNFRCSKWQKL
jgi:hypothetical protein